jgi:hypothetical protein
MNNLNNIFIEIDYIEERFIPNLKHSFFKKLKGKIIKNRNRIVWNHTQYWCFPFFIKWSKKFCTPNEIINLLKTYSEFWEYMI